VIVVLSVIGLVFCFMLLQKANQPDRLKPGDVTIIALLCALVVVECSILLINYAFHYKG
jgi:hypothetical protein